MSDNHQSRESTQLFVTISGQPQVLQGTLLSEIGGLFEVELTEEVSDLTGSAVLYFPESDRERALTQIEEVSGKKVTCHEGQHISPDKRAFPRLFAGLRVNYKTITVEDGQNWYDNGDDPEGTWHETDEYMNFSVTGLAFDGTGACDRGEALALKVSIGKDETIWRLTGHVIRCVLIEESEQQELENGKAATHRIAMSFDDIPKECSEALAVLTNKVLDRS